MDGWTYGRTDKWTDGHSDRGTEKWLIESRSTRLKNDFYQLEVELYHHEILQMR